MYIDSHAHLLSKGLIENTTEVLSRAHEARLSNIINISCRREEWADAIEFCSTHTKPTLTLHPTVGIHPDFYGAPEAPHYEKEVKEYQSLLESTLQSHPSIVAIGECGLDYYREYHRDAQIALFEMQIQVAMKYNLPLVVHIREAFDDYFTIMDIYPEAKVILHCFTGSKEQAQKILSYANTVISFSGIVTFDKTGAMESSVKEVPLERMLIETDSPYLAPVPVRGKTNEPSFVVHTATKIAAIKNISLEEVARQTTENTKRVFGLLNV